MTDMQGFYVDPPANVQEQAATMEDLQQMVQNGDITFSPGSNLTMTGCNTATAAPNGEILAQELSEVTGGIVNGGVGGVKSYDVGDAETGWFSADGGWDTYNNGQEVQNPWVNNPDMTPPNQYGMNYLRVYGNHPGP